MIDTPLSEYEEKLYEQLEKSRKDIKFWQERASMAELKVQDITIKYNQACIDIQHLRRCK